MAPDSNPKPRSTGIPVDASGGPTIDPTKNVLDLVGAAVTRLNDLREATKELSDTQVAHIKELVEIRAQFAREFSAQKDQHNRDIRNAEAQRLDSIRQVDREDVNKTAAQALAAIQTLAATTNTTAETLRTQVATTAAAAQTSLVTITNEINKRLSQLEQTSFESRGKQALADPQMADLIAEMRLLRAARSEVVGGHDVKVEGRSNILLIISIVGGLVGLGGFLIAAIVLVLRFAGK